MLRIEIQRDIDSILAFLEKEKTSHYLVYDRTQKVYQLETSNESFLQNLASVKILIESRAFQKVDMDRFIDKLIHLAQPQPAIQAYINV